MRSEMRTGVLSVRIGVVDSGYPERLASSVDAALGFRFDSGDVLCSVPTEPDRIGHGSAICAVLAAIAPEARLHVAQVFQSRGVTSAMQISHAIHWLVDQRVRIINLSLGVRSSRPALRDACARAVARGVVLFASSPARGEPVFPASYPGVVRVTGDARCGLHQWSWLDSGQADFGAVVSSGETGSPAGASVACAALSGRAAYWLARHPGAGSTELLAYLHANAAFVGIERRIPAP